MGYSEVTCQICGVSFNVSRWPTAEEVVAGLRQRPWLDGATHDYGHKWDCVYGQCQVIDTREAELDFSDDGRQDDDGHVDWGSDRLHKGDDGFYQPETDSVEEEYEYDTPNESEEETSVGASETTTDSMDGADPAPVGDSLYQAFIDSLPAQEPGSRYFWAKHMRLINEEDASSADDRRWMDYQHVSGRGCRNTGAYNGHLLSAEEARGCSTLQCLVPKSRTEPFLEEKLDEPFEKTGGFFLTGLSDKVPCADDQWPATYPPRHNTDRPKAANFLLDSRLVSEYAIPFHPTCLEVFKRACLHRYGEVNIQALMDWYSFDASCDVMLSEFPRHEAVREGRRQYWEHWRGDEFLAADPCFIPSLKTYLDKAMARGSTITSPYEAAVPTGGCIITSVGNDCFSRLPFEIRVELLVRLEPGDIANLRLASKTYRTLPQYLFRKLLQQNYPWVYEAWCTLPYSFWATKEGWDIRKIDEDWEDEREFLETRIQILKQEVLPDSSNEDAIASIEECLKRKEVEYENNFQSRPATHLPVSKTDWYRLFCDITQNRQRINGLRNRERIWKDCNEILDRVEGYRAAGRLEPEMTDTKRREETRATHDVRTPFHEIPGVTGPGHAFPNIGIPLSM
ncbi:unnamed protein product [Clonostachys rosea]|uniref:F-box domain-containing protein n=1 Tax=Bionectria ochroleuca TaxID=29856 RepID=A0ABY6UYY6_BIOOC|nr:unnamed protein product [Clonostachys rosea]